MKKTLLTVAVFALCAAGIAAYLLRQPAETEKPERHRMRVVVPSGTGPQERGASLQEHAARDGAYILKAPMESGELVISVLNFDFDNSGIEDQVVAFRGGASQAGSPPENGGEKPVAIAFFAFDERDGAYRRVWDLPTSATVPGTVSMTTMDLLGDRNNVIVVTGMNEKNEHVMTVFRRGPQADRTRPFDVIADIRIDGSVAVQESQRSLAYQQGIARGEPFRIVASGRDPESDNILDRIELTYSFDPAGGVYRRTGRVRIPGARIEQDRVRQVLSGAPGVFENFIGDIWYHVTPQGTIDRSQFIFFDPAQREIIFFGEESQQVFVWQNSNTTRQGIFISSHNSAVTTMRRLVNVEFESMDGIRVTVTDNRRQRIGIPPPWSGSYRRAAPVLRTMASENLAPDPHKDAVFDSPMGRFRFMPNGAFELSAHGSFSRGRHVFFRSGGEDLLELRPESSYAGFFAAHSAGVQSPADGRQVFRVTGITRNAQGRPDAHPEQIALSRVRLGASGIQELHEGQIVLTRAE